MSILWGESLVLAELAFCVSSFVSIENVVFQYPQTRGSSARMKRRGGPPFLIYNLPHPGHHCIIFVCIMMPWNKWDWRIHQHCRQMGKGGAAVCRQQWWWLHQSRIYSVSMAVEVTYIGNSIAAASDIESRCRRGWQADAMTLEVRATGTRDVVGANASTNPPQPIWRENLS